MVQRKEKVKTFEGMINFMLNSLELPHNLWGETLFTINYILNRIQIKKTNKSPYEL